MNVVFNLLPFKSCILNNTSKKQNLYSYTPTSITFISVLPIYFFLFLFVYLCSFGFLYCVKISYIFWRTLFLSHIFFLYIFFKCCFILHEWSFFLNIINLVNLYPIVPSFLLLSSRDFQKKFIFFFCLFDCSF